MSRLVQAICQWISVVAHQSVLLTLSNPADGGAQMADRIDALVRWYGAAHCGLASYISANPQTLMTPGTPITLYLRWLSNNRRRPNRSSRLRRQPVYAKHAQTEREDGGDRGEPFR